ncbi:MAG: hypothetical protein HOV94_27745 [Saccharothrix sp.]|nr:hypothetical protein [Saccharothrix sp.]
MTSADEDHCGGAVARRTRWQHWAAVGVITVVGWVLTLVVMRNYRSPIPCRV